MATVRFLYQCKRIHRLECTECPTWAWIPPEGVDQTTITLIAALHLSVHSRGWHVKSSYDDFRNTYSHPCLVER